MPFYCGKRSAGICVVLGSKNPRRISANTPPGFSSLAPLICEHLLCLATKDYSDRLLVTCANSIVPRGVVCETSDPTVDQKTGNWCHGSGQGWYSRAGRCQKLGRTYRTSRMGGVDRRACERCDGRGQRGGEICARQPDDRSSAG